MIFADPPYGIKVVPKSGKLGKGTNYMPMIGDDSTATAKSAYHLYTDLFEKSTQLWWGANYYITALKPSRCWIIWDKENGTTSFADAELAWSNIKSSVRIFRHRWNGANRASERGQPRYHPAQKPIRLAMWFYEKYGKDNDIVLDPFIGSGITILASALLEDNRHVYGIEILPHYCDVTIARYEALSGNTAHLIERIEKAAVVAAASGLAPSPLVQCDPGHAASIRC